MKNSYIPKSFDILHSIFFLLFLICINHVLYVTSSQNIVWLVVSMAVKVFLFAGTLGVLVDLASQEYPSLNYSSFHNNVRKYWKTYAGLFLLQLVLTNLVSDGLERLLGGPVNFFAFEFVTLYAMAHLVIKDKFAHHMQSKRPVKLPTFDIFFLSLVTLGIFIILNIQTLFHIDPRHWTNEPTAIYYYLHLFVFAYFVTAIIQTYPEIEKSFDHEKELYLINPLGAGISFGLVSSWMRMYPPAFVVLKALTPTSYHVKDFNRLHWKKRFFKKNKLVAITCFTSNCPEAYKIAKEFKRQGSTVIMGGPHVSYVPNEALRYCDAVVIGEAESVWKQIIADYEGHQLKQIYNGSSLSDFEQEVHEKLLDSPEDVVLEYLETTRGCKFKCRFCTIPSLSNGSVRRRPIPQIIELIQKVKRKFGIVNFIDNNIYNDPAYARELFKALKPLKVWWTTQCTIDIAKNDETLALAKDSGAKFFLIGYETFGDSAEKTQGGKFSMNAKYLEYSRKIKKAGIRIKAHLIYGFETDRLKHIWDIYKFCLRLWPSFTVVSILTPLPGSQLFYDMQKENRITNYNWRYYDCHNLVFRHQHIKDIQLKFGFALLKYTALFTAGSMGIFFFIFFLLDYIFFQWRHL